MNQPLNLTLEQEFNQRLFADQVQRLSREEAQEMLIMLHEHMMLKDNVYKALLSQDWGIKLDSTSVS
ncbi:NblA/ycf18 family protein [Pleurocapsales cyanobacterium LEGE 06147]|nr:NblA/ycf18 family protein [Pleurocapsales cyanobacterium LEGE 06147]